jgi:hypothetical protein|tara:strand:+ start:3877 stop:4311 length:435 start_codon:yes stop_codon:yes gene_type:complete
MKYLFRFINPFVRVILKSPIHFILSHQILLFRVIGRKSKKIYEIPASYAHINDALVCVTLRENLWWKNFIDIENQDIYFKGKKINKKISINFSDDNFVRTKLKELIEHNPIDAFFAGVKLDRNKVPNSEDLDKAAKLHTVIILK